ncbi:aminotransferase class I/II-fold pyridoxal phosphate-dependent enzyme [Actinoplanes sp. NPDC049802]|uniref:aminotransferase class I/II-fold pyridoxal phosphate-dependent enzyme n=1 Tax=Actinoplanes sp. NPDC049802 TaxID=3154742 RepID=UPI0033D85972
MNPETLTNTEYERIALSSRINLSDGHSRLPLTASQRQIVGQMPQMLSRIDQMRQEALEDEFVEQFFACAGQPSASSTEIRRFLNYSSSCSIKIAAQYCRMMNLQVFLMEPCFDNIRHMLLTEGVQVDAIAESMFRDLSAISKLAHPKAAFWIVFPNNPTGFGFGREDFGRLIDTIAAAGATVIVDFCFRFYMNDLAEWDQYRVLIDSGTSFVAIEDTGKTWGVSDLKVGLTTSSADAGDVLHRLHDQLLLNVSGLQLMLLTSMIRDSIEQGIDVVVREPVELNRSLIHSLVGPNLFEHASPYCRNVPLEYLRLPNHYDAVRFWRSLKSYGVDILPGTNYYWSAPDAGRDCLRIPLARPQNELRAAVPLMRQALDDCR